MDASLNRDDFHYDLPQRLIAQYPAAERTGSRLLVLEEAGLSHRQFPELIDCLRAGDLLVVNDTRVIKARLLAEKDSGGRAEILLERLLSDTEALCQVRVSKRLQPGRTLRVAGLPLDVLGRHGQFYRLRFPASVLDILEAHGTVPLPPYIERAATGVDESRYQTVWNRTPGAVAAPTAGLHFTEGLLEEIQAAGVDLAYVTLHVGAGTFQPVRSTDLAEHQMHEERYSIDPATVQAIAATHRRGGRIVAVGTTVVRALESAASGDHVVQAGAGETDLFITPGYRFQVVDALITNFHLPQSTLLMLVAAFGGYRQVMAAYRVAIDCNYRFFSYGDAMFVHRLEEQSI